MLTNTGRDRIVSDIESALDEAGTGLDLDAATDAGLELAPRPLPLYDFDDLVLELFQGQSAKPEVLAELFWASLHGIAELTRTKRFPPSRQKERVRTLVDLFSVSKEEPARR